MTNKVCWLEKRCRKCDQVFDLKRFSANRYHFDGRENACMKCKRGALGSSARANAVARCAAWRGTDRGRAINRAYKRRDRAKPEVRIAKRMSEMMRRALMGSKARASWSAFVDYSAADLRAHLERQFTAGMDWAAFMRGEIHIDHIVPQAKFTFDSPTHPEFRRCWALTNLQPLWALDNIRKGARIAA